MIRILMEHEPSVPGFMKRDPLWRQMYNSDRRRRYRAYYSYLRGVPLISSEAYATLIYCEDHAMTPPQFVLEELEHVRDAVREASERYRELFREGDDEC